MAGHILEQFRGNRLSTLAWLVLAGAAAAAIAWYSARHVVLQASLFGFTPVGMMHPVTLVSDFPNGEAEMMKSLVGRAYQFVGLIGWPDQAGAMAMIALEALALLAGAGWLARRANPHLPTWTVVGAAVLLSAGTIASADFARWFHPVYGSVYNFAFGAAFSALAATLERRLVLGGLLIGIAVAIHPIIALLGGIGMALAVLADIRSYRSGQIAAGIVAAGVVAALWYVIAFRGAAITGGFVDRELFTTLTRLMSSHWHPMDLEIFGDRAWEVLLPFCALIVVVVAALAMGSAETAVVDRQIAVAAAGLFVVSLVGLWLSDTTTNPLLIKLALHRASLVVLLFAAIVSVPRLMALAVHGPFLTAMTAGGLLLLPFWRWHGLPLAGAVVFALFVISGLGGPITRRGRFWVVAVLGLAATVCIALAITGHAGALWFDVVATIASVATKSFFAAFALIVAARLFRLPVLAAAAFAIGLSFWAPQIDPMRSADDRANAEAYLEAQQWARANTPPESVFMLDPVLSYAWRQYSKRPSFGSMREWLYSGWIYNTDPAIMAEGMRRAGLLGIGPDDFKPAPGHSIGDTYATLVAKARAAFNSMDADQLARLSRDNGIAYFVFERAGRSDFSGLSIVFENARFVITKPSA